MTFCISEPIDGEPASAGNGSTIGFNIEDEAQGDKWHAAGLEAGGISIEDAPGVREFEGHENVLSLFERSLRQQALCN